MEEYKRLQDLKKDWFTTNDLFIFLQKNGFSVDPHKLRRWEKLGVIPTPKRSTLKNREWRIYSKDGKDFEKILNALKNRTRLVFKLVKA